MSGKFINYLLTIAVNTCKNHFKKKTPEWMEHDVIMDRPCGADVSEEVMRLSDAERVQQALDRLPEMQREVIILRFYHDRKLKDIASITGVGLATAKSRLHQALGKLKHDLDREDLWE